MFGAPAELKDWEGTRNDEPILNALRSTYGHESLAEQD